MTINKAILAPFIAALALFIKQAFGYEISGDMQDAAVNIALFAVMGAGLFMHPKKVEKEQLSDQEKLYL